MPALILGVAVGIICVLACSKIEATFRYDDSLDAFGVHGVGGTLGALLTGVFAPRTPWDLNCHQAVGLLEGGPAMKVQITAVVVTWVFSIVADVHHPEGGDAIMGSRVTEHEERLGLDVTQHEEEGYIFV